MLYVKDQEHTQTFQHGTSVRIGSIFGIDHLIYNFSFFIVGEKQIITHLHGVEKVKD